MQWKSSQNFVPSSDRAKRNFFGINWKFCNTKINSEKSKLYRYKNYLQSDFSVLKIRNKILFGGLLRTKKETKEGDEFQNRRMKAELALTKKKWFFFLYRIKSNFSNIFFCCAAKFQRNLSLVLCESYFRLKILCLSPLPLGWAKKKSKKKKNSKWIDRIWPLCSSGAQI